MTSEIESEAKSLGLPELIAMGVGGMIGGGIFTVLGIAVDVSGHAAPFAFAVGSCVALVAGYSYVKLALTFRSDGASFTYIERAFPNHPNLAGVTGWTVIVGYVGTLALYAFTFGAYGADLLGSPGSGVARAFLSSGVLLFFMVVNILGAHASGRAEDLIVYTKIILLALFAVIGLSTVDADHLTPVFNQGVSSVFIGGAIIFVAFEGFQLITNSVTETRDPDRNIPRGIYGSIIITSLIYVAIAVVGVGNLTPAEIASAKEYALAVAAQPVLGEAGRVLVGIAALLATSSAINATEFGASRMMAEMATERMMPHAFSFRSRTRHVPWLAVITMTGLALTFTVTNTLESIAEFSSLTFLLVSIAVCVANFRLRKKTGSNPWLIVAGITLMTVTVALLLGHLWQSDTRTLVSIGTLYGSVFAAELLFSKRGLLHRRS
jgi:amino acid transporter